ncbi:MAG TPA: hypothetical protein VFW77_00540 [Candidatus Saccharimonadales bacterium]|nr:hypothetical protein [Candidatus Saccharimonadales bacterium]
MFEKLKPRQEGGWLSRTAHNLWVQGFHEEESKKAPAPPEPFTAIVIKDGEAGSRTFRDEDTHLVFCEEKPEYSFILQVVLDEKGDVAVDGNGEPLDAEYIFGNPELMAEMAGLGFQPEYESAEDAAHFYNLAHPADDSESNVRYI